MTATAAKTKFDKWHVASTRAYDWTNATYALKLDYTATHAESIALAPGEYMIDPTSDCFITIGETPVAAKAAGSFPVKAGAMFHVQVGENEKISAVRDSADGSLYIMPVKSA